MKIICTKEEQTAMIMQYAQSSMILPTIEWEIVEHDYSGPCPCVTCHPKNPKIDCLNCKKWDEWCMED